MPQTPKPVFNLVMSLRQIGVPLGGVLAALILPPLTLAVGWRGALLAELGPILLLIAAMEAPRHRWDRDREPGRRVFGRPLLQPFALLRDPRFRRLSVAAFVYAGLALCLVAFMTVQLTTVVGLSLVQAGRILAVYQIAGSVSRPIWGWIADRLLTPAQTLAVLGVGMVVAAVLTGLYDASWPVWAVTANAVLGGCTSAGTPGSATPSMPRWGAPAAPRRPGWGPRFSSLAGWWRRRFSARRSRRSGDMAGVTWSARSVR